MIKYHDNMHGQQYGPDHHLTDNWPPEPIYGADEYIRAFFRVDCPAYVFKGGFPSFEREDQRAAFFEEARGVLAAFGVPEGTGHSSEKLPGMEHLYIHPQNISGVVAKNRVKPIAEELAACKTFSVRWVDLYEDISTMTDEEFRARLYEQKTEIGADILAAYRTKRSNLYIVDNYWSSPLRALADKYTIPRRSCESGADELCVSVLGEIFDELVAAGAIVSAETKSGTGYRTAKKGEKKSA